MLHCLNVLVYSPLLLRSHVTFIAKLADILAENGHNVTLAVSQLNPQMSHHSLHVQRVLTVPPSDELSRVSVTPVEWNDEISPKAQKQVMTSLGSLLGIQCHHFLVSDVIEQLAIDKYDVLLHEVFDMCGLALTEILGMERHIIVSSTREMDTVPYSIGMMNPLTDPALLSDFSSSFSVFKSVQNIEYLKNFLGFTELQVDLYSQLLKEKYGIIKPFKEIIRASSAMFVNLQPIFTGWKPTAKNVFYIGGIAVETPSSLDEDYDNLISKWSTVVLVSFGTVIPAHKMPSDWKTGLLEAMKTFPDILFIWKYEQTDTFMENSPENVVFRKFTPQNDILNCGKVSLFITHGGQNSLLESAKAGVPMLVVPLFGDQFRNAKSVEEAGIGRILDRSQLHDSRLLHSMVVTAMADNQLRDRAILISQAMLSPAISPDQIFLRNFEYYARSFETFEEFPQSIDVLFIYDYFSFFLLTVLLAPLFIVVLRKFMLEKWTSKLELKETSTTQ